MSERSILSGVLLWHFAQKTRNFLVFAYLLLTFTLGECRLHLGNENKY